jgi:hypothetical protein
MFSHNFAAISGCALILASAAPADAMVAGEGEAVKR